MKRRFKAAAAVLLMMLTVIMPHAYATRGELIRVNVTVNGSPVTFEDQQPVIVSGRTLLPIRGVMEALGKEVSWSEEDSRAVISDGSTTVSLGVGDNIMVKSSGGRTENTVLDTVPANINGRVCLPVRAVAEAFGATVEWDGATRTVTINGN
jgi:hypothetical protein